MGKGLQRLFIYSEKVGCFGSNIVIGIDFSMGAV